MLTEQQIEELAQQFEDDWSSDNAGPGSVKTFLAARHCTAPYPLALVATLTSIDIELAWQHWNKSLGKTELMDGQHLIERLRGLPRIENYLELLGEVVATNDHWQDLIQCEAAARSNWGDNIGPAHYLHRFGVAISTKSQVEPHRVQVVCQANGHTDRPPLTACLRGETRLGRQRSTDETSWAVIDSPEEPRIIIAGRHEVHISRNHLLIAVLNQKYAVLLNNVEKRDSLDADEGNLKPGAVQMVSFPFIVRVAGIKLRCE